jgi:phosphoribosylaminoimidazole carboxylase
MLLDPTFCTIIMVFPQRGIPVATVAINNGMNAGLLAVRILSAGIPRLVIAMDAYMKKMEGEVMSRIETLEQVGWETYQNTRST